NPLVREAVLPRVTEFDNVLVTEPLSYGEFTTVMAATDVVLTDSGGIQEEAPSLGKPVLVMRENTERPEAVTAGSVALVGTERSAIVTEVSRLFDDARGYASMARAVNPYGDVRAADRSVAAIEALLGVGYRIDEITDERSTWRSGQKQWCYGANPKDWTSPLANGWLSSTAQVWA